MGALYQLLSSWWEPSIHIRGPDKKESNQGNAMKRMFLLVIYFFRRQESIHEEDEKATRTASGPWAAVGILLVQSHVIGKDNNASDWLLTLADRD